MARKTNIKKIIASSAGVLTLAALWAASSGAAAKAADLDIPIVKASAEKSAAVEGWTLKEWTGRSDVEVVDTEIGKTIHMKSNSASTALYREEDLNVKEYPFIHWKWKATRLPKGADVRNKSTDDQAAQLYVIFPYKWPASINSRLVGYIWDTTAPEGSVVTSTKTDKVKYIVLRSGKDGLGQWLTETRNVYEDYKRLFNEEPPVASGVSVMIDSDDTKSAAESYIGDIHLAKGPAR